MARQVVHTRGISIRIACEVFTISQTCFRYVATRRVENDCIADWLVRLTTVHRSWGFGLCYLYLRNVKGFGWNHKRVYRIYRDCVSSHGSVWRDQHHSRYQSPQRRMKYGRWTSCTISWSMAAAFGCST
jgi:hypothetical protein